MRPFLGRDLGGAEVTVTTGEKERAGIAPRTTVGLSVPLSHSYYSALSLNLTGGERPFSVSRRLGLP